MYSIVHYRSSVTYFYGKLNRFYVDNKIYCVLDGRNAAYTDFINSSEVFSDEKFEDCRSRSKRARRQKNDRRSSRKTFRRTFAVRHRRRRTRNSVRRFADSRTDDRSIDASETGLRPYGGRRCGKSKNSADARCTFDYGYRQFDSVQNERKRSSYNSRSKRSRSCFF